MYVRLRLIKSFTDGIQALLDCCHSENLLGDMRFTFPLHCFFDVPSLIDLQKGDGPNIYSREWKVGPGQLFIGQSEQGHLSKLER